MYSRSYCKHLCYHLDFAVTFMEHRFTLIIRALGFSEQYMNIGFKLKSLAVSVTNQRICLSFHAFKPGNDIYNSVIKVIEGVFFKSKDVHLHDITILNYLCQIFWMTWNFCLSRITLLWMGLLKPHKITLATFKLLLLLPYFSQSS